MSALLGVKQSLIIFVPFRIAEAQSILIIIMVFSSFIFLFFFLPFVFFINRFLPVRISNIFLLVTSLFFYYVGEGGFTILLFISIVWNYVFGLLLKTNNQKKRVFLLGICIAGNLSLLLYYKYTIFLMESFGLSVFVPSFDYKSILLPIGISFFTFHGISYIMDVYRKSNLAETNFIKMGLYIAFFPQLVAGPIIKYNEIATYLSNRSANVNTITLGTFKFIRGLAKKIILANNFAIISDLVFNMDISSMPTSVAWLGLIFYTLQIYYDFSGYSDMAIGLGLMMGFKIPENFNYPYLAQSLKEFWQRWHISLSTWFKLYLYIPLGGNRLSTYRTYFNLMLVFFVTGLWHGASYNFIIWGMIHGVFLVLERVFPSFFQKMPLFVRHFYTLLVVVLSWVFFRLESLPDSIQFINRLFAFDEGGDYTSFIYLNYYILALVIIGILFTVQVKNRLSSLRLFVQSILPSNWSFSLKTIAYVGLFVFSILELSVATHTPFIYFKF